MDAHSRETMIQTLHVKACRFVAQARPRKRLSMWRAMNPKLWIPAFSLLCVMTVCVASPARATRLNRQDAAFVKMADEQEVTSVRIAKLALSKSSDPRVVAFATRIRDIDSQLYFELRSVALAQRADLPRTVGRENESVSAELSSESGLKFNKTYLTSQLRSDQESLASLNYEVARGSDSFLTAFAQRTIPVIDKHIWLGRRILAVLAKHPGPKTS